MSNSLAEVGGTRPEKRDEMLARVGKTMDFRGLIMNGPEACPGHANEKVPVFTEIAKERISVASVPA